MGADATRRRAFANDPLNLLAVDGPLNMQKGDGDAATWLPPNRSYRCAYVARQVAVAEQSGDDVISASEFVATLPSAAASPAEAKAGGPITRAAALQLLYAYRGP